MVLHFPPVPGCIPCKPYAGDTPTQYRRYADVHTSNAAIATPRLCNIHARLHNIHAMLRKYVATRECYAISTSLFTGIPTICDYLSTVRNYSHCSFINYPFWSNAIMPQAS